MKIAKKISYKENTFITEESDNKRVNYTSQILCKNEQTLKGTRI